MCPTCEGTGQCSWCAGVGTLAAAETADLVPCPHCYHPGDPATGTPGDGLCAACAGTGLQTSSTD